MKNSVGGVHMAARKMTVIERELHGLEVNTLYDLPTTEGGPLTGEVMPRFFMQPAEDERPAFLNVAFYPTSGPAIILSPEFIAALTRSVKPIPANPNAPKTPAAPVAGDEE